MPTISEVSLGLASKFTFAQDCAPLGKILLKLNIGLSPSFEVSRDWTPQASDAPKWRILGGV